MVGASITCYIQYNGISLLIPVMLNTLLKGGFTVQ